MVGQWEGGGGDCYGRGDGVDGEEVVAVGVMVAVAVVVVVG